VSIKSNRKTESRLSHLFVSTVVTTMSRPAKERTSSVGGADQSLDDDIDNPHDNNNDAALLWCFQSTDVTQASILFAVTFFTSMVAMELILEGTQNAFSDFLGLPYAVTLFQFISCCALPIATTRGNALQHLPRTTNDVIPYIFLSLVVFGSTCFKSLSVRYVSFPTKVIFKSTKLIPTMMISTLFQHYNAKHYGKRDYLAALLLCAGAAGYSYGESAKNDDKQDSHLGLLLLAISVLCDAFTPNLQQRFMAPPTKAPLSVAPLAVSHSQNNNNNDNNNDNNGTSTSNTNIFDSMDVCLLILPRGGGGLGLSASVLMCNTNAVGVVGTLLFMFLSGHVHDAIGVALVRPHLFGNLVLIGFFLALAVLAHIRLIKESVR
jgi:hypothetical protein